MRFAKISGAVSAVAMVLTASAISHADFSYNFDSGAVTGSANPGTPLIGTPTVGAVGQDNWILTSGPTATPIVRTDALPGFSGNYIRGTVADATTTTQDTIVSRWNGSSLGLTGQFATFSADILVGVGGQGTSAPIYRRSEVAVGVDSTGDGKIRPTSAATDNAEWGVTFGYEAAAGTGSGWYVRPPNLGTAVTIPAPTVSGVWRVQLVADLTANSNNGSGTLYVKQIADEAGNPVNDVFRLAGSGLSNFNLGIQRMLTAANGGSAYAANPANWDGMLARIAGNGGIDNISFVSGLPNAGGSVWAADAGNWLSSGNWYISTPNAVDAVASFTAGVHANSTVYADSAITVGTINFDNAASSYVISGLGSLTLQTSAGSASVNVVTGSHKLNLPLIVASNTTLSVASGTTLRISDPVTVNAGKSITQTGGGTVLYEAPITVLNGGAITLGGSQTLSALSLGAGATASLGTPTGGGSNVVTINALGLASGAHVDVGVNELRVPGTASAVRAAISNGAFITTAADDRHGLGYGDTGDGKVRVLFTLNGDANLDRTIDFADLTIVAANYQQVSAATYTAGDFTLDGAVNFADLALLAKNYDAAINGGLLPAGASAEFASDWRLAQSIAPEPTTLTILGLPLAIAARRRRG